MEHPTEFTLNWCSGLYIRKNTKKFMCLDFSSIDNFQVWDSWFMVRF